MVLYSLRELFFRAMPRRPVRAESRKSADPYPSLLPNPSPSSNIDRIEDDSGLVWSLELMWGAGLGFHAAVIVK